MSRSAARNDDQGSKSKGSSLADLGPAWISAIAALLTAVVAAIALIATHPGSSGSPSPSASTTTGHTGQTARTALAPAVTGPVVAECSARLAIGADGNATPLTCTGGRLNVVAWQFFAKNNLLVMSLGPNALPDQVQRAMCSDVADSTPVIELSAYRLASVYYGWRFGVDPAQDFPSQC